MMKSISEVIRYCVRHKAILILILFAYLLTLIRVLPDGQYGCVGKSCGMIIGGNYRDGVWFMAVAANAFKTLPFQMPIFAGAPLQGYHFLPSLFMYLVSLLGIPITIINYKIFPMIYMLGITYILILLGRKIKDHPVFIFFLLVFFLLGIPLTTVTTLLHNTPINNGLLINTFQSTKIFDSLPTAFSFLMLFGGLLILIQKDLTRISRILLGILLFLLFGTKFYTAFLLASTIALFELLTTMRKKQSLSSLLLRYVWYFVCVGISVLIFYDPLNTTKSGSIFVFAPFATVHHLIESPSMFTLNNMVLARYYLYEHGFSPRLLVIELFSTFLYMLFYFGPRILGFLYLIKRFVTQKITIFELSTTFSVILAIIISVLFIQKGDWFNPIQFAVCASYVLCIYAGLFMYDLWKYKGKILFVLFSLIICVVLLPSNLVNLEYLTSVGREVIPNEEMKGMAVLKNKPNGTIFVPMLGADSPYVPIFTGKQTYVNFTNVLENTGIPFKDREKAVSDAKQIDIDTLPVSYVFIPKRFEGSLLYTKVFLKSKKYTLILENKGVVVFEKKRK